MYAALALAVIGSVAGAWSNGTTVTDEVSYFTTYCPSPTTFAHGNSTYTVTAATTMTIEDCSCTASSNASSNATTTSSSPTQANGAGTKGAAVAGVAAAIAYLI